MPKNKRQIISDIKKLFINNNISEFDFKNGTNTNLYLFQSEQPVRTTLISISYNKKKDELNLLSTDNVRKYADAEPIDTEFEASELTNIHKILSKQINEKYNVA